MSCSCHIMGQVCPDCDEAPRRESLTLGQAAVPETVVIIGRRVTPDSHPDLAGRIGSGEGAVEVTEAELLKILGGTQHG